MSLSEYKRKRQLKNTPEPSGGKKHKDGSGVLQFVVQRHKATSLHYDFRLELGGSLKSWAVPKGPSLNPKDKRLAMKVEDHPLDYAGFEGVIPEGNYGAGIVEIWDNGTYEPVNWKKDEDPEKVLQKELKNGSLKIDLKGKKLKGEFALVKMKNKQENAWLLIKHNDEHATDKKYSSEQQTKANSPINKALKSQKKNSTSKTSSGAKTTKKKSTSAKRPEAEPRRGKDIIQPMLAKTTDQPFSSADWVFEIKWDGYRAIAETGPNGVRLYSRKGISFTKKYETVTLALQKIKVQAVLDGEIVVLDEQGRPSFQRLQDYANNEQDLYYYVFDLLFLDGQDLREEPLLERKALLSKLIDDNGIIRFCEHVKADGEAFFLAAKEKDLEGIIAKKANSLYLSGKRSGQWLKIKNHLSLEAVIGGYTRPRGSRKHFGALILGVYRNEKLKYIGHTGTGFNAKQLTSLYKKMQPLIVAKSPFAEKVPVNNPATWLKPELVCSIQYTEKTAEGILRHPVFQGLRTDKSASEVQWETEITGTTTVVKKEKQKDMETKKTITIHGKKLQLTNLNKVFWPEEEYTKKDVIDYYTQMSGYILPYLKDRPQSLKRNPNGIKDGGFFQKDAGDEVPEWMESIAISSESDNKEVDYVLCNRAEDLMFLSNWGCIEFNPWNSRTKFLDFPDYLIIDIDPSENNDFDDVVEVAKAVKNVFDKAKALSYCKTSGATGMHVYLPVGARHEYSHIRAFAELVANLVHEALPEITTLERSLKKRGKDKIYIDYLQNSRGQTLCSAYSIRPKPGATVSTPLEWKEVKRGLRPDRFTIKNVKKRIEKKGDLFKPVLLKKNSADPEKCLHHLGK